MADNTIDPLQVTAVAVAAVESAKAAMTAGDVAPFEQAMTEFDTAYEFAPAGKRRQHLEAIARRQREERHGAVTLAAQLVEEASAPLTAAIAAAREAPDDLALPAGSGTTREGWLLEKLLRETRDANWRAELRRIGVKELAESYQQAVAQDHKGLVKFLEAEILRGAPDVSARKGKPDENATIFRQLRQRVEANRDARIPAKIREASDALVKAQREIGRWRAVADRLGEWLDYDGLEKRARQYRKDREAGQVETAS